MHSQNKLQQRKTHRTDRFKRGSGLRKQDIEEKKAFGVIIREARERRGLTQEQLGLQSHVSSTQIYRIEKGQSGPGYNTIPFIARALGIDQTYLFVQAKFNPPIKKYVPLPSSSDLEREIFHGTFTHSEN